MKGLIEMLRQYNVPYSGAAGEARVEQGLRDAGVGTPLPQQQQPIQAPPEAVPSQPAVDPKGLLGILINYLGSKSGINNLPRN